jgi:hypothetical protein
MSRAGACAVDILILLGDELLRHGLMAAWRGFGLLESAPTLHRFISMLGVRRVGSDSYGPMLSK